MYDARRNTLSNTFEAQVISALAALLRRHLPSSDAASDEDPLRRFWSAQLATTTRHRAQMSTITNLLVSSGVLPRRPEPQVDTVDRFQGQQRDVVFASNSVSAPDFVTAEEAFIFDLRRFNVTLTRARKKFVVLVSNSHVEHLLYDREIVQQAANFRLFVERYCSPIGRFPLRYKEAGEDRAMEVTLRALQWQGAA
ncbi:MAG: hypothetical protein HY332_23405 [Chloroflexi bacterium]|nr:hypothetical protein [Chloroflexota bacterium]